MPEAELQIDHRVPYEVAGETGSDPSSDDFMLLCGSANRAKSWSCEHCENWRSLKKREICLSCYWAYPESYSHIGMRQVRRLDLLWQGTDVNKFERLKRDASDARKSIPQYVKEIIDRALKPKT